MANKGKYPRFCGTLQDFFCQKDTEKPLKIF